MIHLENVCKRYPVKRGEVAVLQDVNLTVRPGERVGIVGPNGAGKSTLIRMISGAELPTSGSVHRSMTVSWPLAFGGAFQGSLTGLDNLRCICRIYGVSFEDKVAFVRDFAELGDYLAEPVRTYSSGMRSRFAFALSMAVEFDCFLIDEIIAVGDARFIDKCNHELFGKRGNRAMIMATHFEQFIRDHCHTAVVLDGGRLHRFDSVDDAFVFYDEVRHRQPAQAE
jgi:capsular polysaccharide transport system ATP-binding protein